MPSDAEKAVYLNVHETDAVLEEHAETKVLDAPYWLISALQKLQEHHTSFGGDETLAEFIERESEVEPEEPGEFWQAVAQVTMPITGEETIQEVAHQHIQNALSLLNEAIRHKEGPDKIRQRSAEVARLAQEVWDRPDMPETV